MVHRIFFETPQNFTSFVQTRMKGDLIFIFFLFMTYLLTSFLTSSLFILRLQHFLLVVSKFESYVALSVFSKIHSSLPSLDAVEQFRSFDFGDADTYRIINKVAGNPEYKPRRPSIIKSAIQELQKSHITICGH